MQLQPQLGPVPPCVLSADVHTSQPGCAAVYQHLLPALKHLGPGFGWYLWAQDLMPPLEAAGGRRQEGVGERGDGEMSHRWR